MCIVADALVLVESELDTSKGNCSFFVLWFGMIPWCLVHSFLSSPCFYFCALFFNNATIYLGIHRGQLRAPPDRQRGHLLQIRVRLRGREGVHQAGRNRVVAARTAAVVSVGRVLLSNRRTYCNIPA